MDTDDERKQRWFFVSTFNDKLQCEQELKEVSYSTMLARS